MINPKAFLSERVLQPAGLEQKSTRDGFGLGVVEAAKKDDRIVVLSADLSESTRAEWFQKEFPARYIEMGVAEQNMATVASGLANYGKIPCITSYAMFSPGRNWEQIRTTIALTKLPVVICGMHAGVSVGPDGATHQALEDVALMRALPNMTVVVAADKEEARKATLAAVRRGSPVYLRFGRSNTPVFTTLHTPFAIGRAEVLWGALDEKADVALVACGILVHNALLAAHALEAKGIKAVVINNHTVKPLDADTLIKAAQMCGAIVTIEEHQIAGGMGSAVAELLAQKCPVPIEFVGMHDEYGQSGNPAELIEHYGMGVAHIVGAAVAVRDRK